MAECLVATPNEEFQLRQNTLGRAAIIAIESPAIGIEAFGGGCYPSDPEDRPAPSKPASTPKPAAPARK